MAIVEGMMGTAGTALTWVVVGVAILVTGGLAVVATIMIRKQLQYNFLVTIFHYVGENTPPIMKYDKAGIFTDGKTGNKRFFLKKNKAGLNPDSVPYHITEGGKKIVYLIQDGLKNFRFLKFNMDKTSDIQLEVGEEDVNWALNAYERQKKLFASGLLMQLMPYIIIAFVSIVILIIFIYFFKDFAVLKEMAVAMRDAAIAMNGGGTTVV